MSYAFYVTDQDQNKIPVSLSPASRSDCIETRANHWQTDWTSEYIQQDHFDKYAMVVENTGELIGLLACEPIPEQYCLFLAYMEAAPDCNPTLVKKDERKYYDIGRAFIAFSVQLAFASDCDGTLSFRAKTTALLEHYTRVYGAKRLNHYSYDLILFPEDGIRTLKHFTKEDNE